MRIVQLEAAGRGPGTDEDHVHRTVQPGRALGELPGVSVTSGSFLSPPVHAELASADVLVVGQVVEPDLLAVMAARRAAGRLTVYEMRDHVLAPQAAAAAAADNPLLRSLSRQLGARAHAVQFRTGALARAFAQLQPPERQAIFRDQLSTMPAAARGANKGDRLWLGVRSSRDHLEDLRWVLPALAAALTRHTRLGLAITVPAALLPEVAPLVQDLPRARVRIIAAGADDAYPAGVDLGVCPLLSGDFNRCRGDARWLELAARGVPALASDLGPYREAITSGRNGLLFRGLAELGAQIDGLIAEPERRARLGAAARADVAHGRTERDHAPARLAQYRRWQELAGREAGVTVPADSPGPGGYREIGDDATERALRAGLAHAGAGDNDEAFAAFAAAAASAPDFYLPALYRASLEPDDEAALAVLAHAGCLAPQSPMVAFQRGLRLAATGRLAEARHAFAACRALAPGLGAAEVQLGALAEAEGDLATAAACYEAAYASNPYFTPAVLRLAQHALNERNPGRATRLLESALAHDPKMWRFHYLLGRAFCAVGRWRAAHHHLESALGEADQPAAVLALLARTQIALGDVGAAKATVRELRRLGAVVPMA